MSFFLKGVVLIFISRSFEIITNKVKMHKFIPNKKNIHIKYINKVKMHKFIPNIKKTFISNTLNL